MHVNKIFMLNIHVTFNNKYSAMITIINKSHCLVYHIDKYYYLKYFFIVMKKI